MADGVKLQYGSVITFADSGGDYALTLASLATTAARQSAKCDFGTNPAPAYSINAYFDTGTAPTAGGLASVYAGWSKSASGGNPAGLGDADAAYTGYSSNLANSIIALGAPIYWVTATAKANTYHTDASRLFVPVERYMTLVVYNQWDQNFSAATDMWVKITPVYDISATVT